MQTRHGEGQPAVCGTVWLYTMPGGGALLVGGRIAIGCGVLRCALTLLVSAPGDMYWRLHVDFARIPKA